MNTPTWRLATLLLTSTLWLACSASPGGDDVLPTVPAPPETLSEVGVFPNPAALIRTVVSEPLPDALPQDTDTATTVDERAKLSVTGVHHIGRHDLPTRLEVRFSHPMKRFEGVRALADVPDLTLTPSVEADVRWLDAGKVEITPKTPLQLATRYSLRVSGLMASTEGEVLDAPHVHRFDTRRVQISWATWGNVRYPAQRKPDGWVEVNLNLPVSAKAFKRAVRLTVAGSTEALAAGSGQRARAVIEPIARSSTSSVIGYRVRPAAGFEIGRFYRVEVLPTLLPEQAHGGLPMAASRVIVARGPERLAVSSYACAESVCGPGVSWRVYFNNALKTRGPHKCLTVSPAIDAKYVVTGSAIEIHPKDAKVGTTYTVTATKACTDVFGTHPQATWRQGFTVVPPPARLRMVNDTGYMPPPLDGAAPTVKLEVADTGPLAVRLRRISLSDLPAFITGQLEGYGGYALASLTELGVKPTRIDPPRTASGKFARLGVPLTPALNDGRGLVVIEVTTTQNGTYDEPTVRRSLVQVSDIGLTAKASPAETLVWASSLQTGSPLAGVDIRFYSADGTLLATKKTGANGLALGPGSGERNARAVAAAGPSGDLSLLDLKDWTTNVEAYRFDLPYAWNPPASKLVGQVFTERGVYRAGEKVFIKGFVKVDRGKGPEPLASRESTVTVIDAQGDLVHTAAVTLGAYGDFDLTLPLAGGAPLGTYTIAAAVEASADAADDSDERPLQGRFRVEAYRPNTFEVKVALDANDDGKTLATEIVGRYLHGAPMAGATVRWWTHVKAADFSPSGFDGFSFQPDRSDIWWQPTERTTASLTGGEGILDDDGRIADALELAAIDRAAGPQSVVIEAEVVDLDEQVVSGRSAFQVHPGDFYLGVKRGRSVVEAGTPVSLTAVAVAPDGKPLSRKRVTVEVIRRAWTSTRTAIAGGGYTWSSEQVDTAVERATVDLKGAAQPLPQFTPTQAGLHIVKLETTDDAGRAIRTATRLWVWGGGEASWARSDDERVNLILDKKRYNVGDTLGVMVQSPYAQAHALVTVERLGVLHQQTIAVSGNAPLIEIPVTSAMIPNAFVSVVLVRGEQDQKPEDNGAAKIGYAAFDVSRAEKRLDVSVEATERTYRPGDRVHASIRVTDAAGRPVSGQATFMAVDEGVLSLTGYKTPNPLNAFFGKQPIAFVTADARRRMWRSMDPAHDGIKGDWGGGGDEEGEATNYRSAFATTAAFFPQVEVGRDGIAEVTFDLPDNLGAFRLMAVVAGSDTRFGAADSRIAVNKPLLVRSGLPRFLSTGDVFDAQVVVQALDASGAGPVDVALKTAGPLAIVGSDHKRVALTKGRATTVSFKVRATKPGDATFAFKAVREGRADVSDALEITLPVHHPTVKRSITETGTVGNDHGAPGVAAREITLPDWVHGDVGGLTIELAATQLGQLVPGLHYLVQYPYGCVEQTTGGTLPLLALRELLGGYSLPGMTEAQVTRRAQAGLDRLRSMQTQSGGLGYWPGDAEPHPWGSVYAGMALIRGASLEGLTVPGEVLPKLQRYLRTLLSGEGRPSETWMQREFDTTAPFAAYVLALAGDADPAYHSRLFEKRAELPVFGKALLALAIVEGEGRTPMSDTLVSELTAAVAVTGDEAMVRAAGPYHGAMDSDTRTTALLLMALQKAQPEHNLVEPLARGLMAERRNGHWGTTQSNGFAILALADYFAARQHEGARFLAQVRLGDEILTTADMTSGALQPVRVHVPMARLKALQETGSRLVVTRHGDDVPLYYTVTLDYAPQTERTDALSRGFLVEREYVYADGPRAGQTATEVEAGDLVKVKLMVRTPVERRYVAVDDPLPAGLEPVDTSFETTAQRHRSDDRDWRSRYVFNHIEQQDDRVNLFADRMPAGTYAHSYLARATTKGSFVAAATRAHEMYNPDIFGQSGLTQFEVQ